MEGEILTVILNVAVLAFVVTSMLAMGFSAAAIESVTSRLAGSNQELWKDMSCYLGDPVVDFVSVARGFDIDGETISEPDAIEPAFARAAAVTREGRPYLIDAEIARKGYGAESTWHPEISIADQRSRKV